MASVSVRYKGKATHWKAKRPRAVRVKPSAPISSKAETGRRSSASAMPLLFAALFALFVVAATLKGSLPRVVIGIYGVVSLLTFLAYRSDKLAAQYGRWRTKESTLLLLGLVGGWPGAVLAQKVMRHKSRKTSFQAAFWGTVVVNVTAPRVVGRHTRRSEAPGRIMIPGAAEAAGWLRGFVCAIH